MEKVKQYERIYNIFQSSGAGHLYPKYEKGIVEDKIQKPYFKDSNSFVTYCSSTVPVDMQIVPHRSYTLIDLDDIPPEIEAYLDNHPVWSSTLWYQTRNGRHYIFKIDRDLFIGSAKHKTRVLYLNEFPSIRTIDIPWNGKCPPTKGRKFKKVNKIQELSSIDELEITLLDKPNTTIDTLIPVNDRKFLTDGEIKEVYKRIDGIKKNFDTAHDVTSRRVKIISGVDNAFFRLGCIIADERINDKDAFEMLSYFNATHIMSPVNIEEYKEEFFRKLDNIKKSIRIDKEKKRQVLGDVLNEHVYVYQDDSFINTKTQITIPPAAMNNKLLPLLDKTAPCKEVMQAEAMKTVDIVRYLPGRDMFCSSDEDANAFNIWSRPEYEESEGEPILFLEHVNYIFPFDKRIKREGLTQYSDLVLDFLAYIVQNPGDKHNYALLIYGEAEGTGKSFFFDMMATFIGLNNSMKIGNKAVNGIDNTWMEKEFVYINDIDQFDKHGFVDDMKDSITDRTLSIKKMRQSPYQVTNYMNLAATSNNEMAIFFHNANDRRWLVVETDAEPQEADYYTELFGLLEDPLKCAEIYYYLKRRDLSKYNAKGRPEMTLVKKRMIELSITDLDNDIIDGIVDSTDKSEDRIKLVITQEDVVDSSKYQKKGPRVVAKAFKRQGYRIHSRRVINGRKPTIYVHTSLTDVEANAAVDTYIHKRREVDGNAFENNLN